MLQQQYCLRWKYHHSNLQTMFSSLLDRGCFCDVSLACEEKIIRAHRVVLCACSVYFDSILTNHANERNPIIIMKDAKFNDIKCLVEFMYKGEINVEHDNLASLLKTAEELKIKGLAEVSWRNEKTGATNIDPLAPPVTAELFDSSLLARNSTNVFVKNFNNNSQVAMYPNVQTTVSGTDPQMSPFSPMTMNPAQMSQMQQRHMMNPSSIPQLTPLRIQPGGAGDQVSPMPAKKKRGRPPLDGEFEQYTSQMAMQSIQSAGPLYADRPVDEPVAQPQVESEPEVPVEDLTEDEPQGFLDIVKIEQPDTPEVSDYNDYDSDTNRARPKPKKRRTKANQDQEYVEDEEDNQSVVSEGKGNQGNSSVTLTSQELAEWSDVVKMSDYLTNGRRPQFWEENFTKRVLEAIKNKSLEMKKAAAVLGVSYGTLYGRYREVYGCLKHPYRGPFPKGMQNVWAQVEQNPSDLLNILQRSAMTMTGGQSSANHSASGHMDHEELQQQLRSQGVTLISE